MDSIGIHCQFYRTQSKGKCKGRLCVNPGTANVILCERHLRMSRERYAKIGTEWILAELPWVRG